MSSYEAQIQTRFGKLTIRFDSSEEFAQRLKALDISAISEAIQEHLSTVVVGPPRLIKPVLAEICAFTPEGGIEFLRFPKEKLETIGIVLYAFDPDPVDAATVKKLAAVENPVSYLGKKEYQRYFEKAGRGLYHLSHNGKLWVTNDVIPKLTAKPKKEE